MRNGVFIDSNVIVRHLSGDFKAKKIIDMVESGEIKGLINQIVVSEVLFVYIRLKTGKPSRYLKNNPDMLMKLNLDPVFEVLSIFTELPSSNEVSMLFHEMLKKYGLLPNDALIAATCKHYGIKKIATFDEDFKNVDFLEVMIL